MWPLLVCSFVAMTVAFERMIFYARENAASRRHAHDTEKALELATQGRFDEAALLAKKSASCEGRLVLTAITHRDMVLDETLETHALSELDRHRRGLTILDTIITLAPMLGILGTVTGIIGSFDMLSSDGIQNPAGVTRGIAEALITTAAGLVVSIGALIPFNAFTSHIRSVTRDLEQTAYKAEVACARGVKVAQAFQPVK